ncbi:MAG: type II toxin-antitoxin system RelE/ParE family toxin [Candidatus Brocadiaceae bacterium]|nr:type II toxin-antitoxin system RelE/ParE family toxin [Candidatus Brocadiaceae bacterium]
MAYRVEIKASAIKEIAALPKRERRRVISAIEALADDPRPEGTRKLTGAEDAYRVRVGDYRIVYLIRDDVLTVFVVRVRHRRDVYRRR